MSRRRHEELVPIDEELLRQIADIIGPSSAAAGALAKMAALRAEGKSPAPYLTERNTLVVLHEAAS